jgi:polyhydroxybutyrate depolymerase
MHSLRAWVGFVVVATVLAVAACSATQTTPSDPDAGVDASLVVDAGPRVIDAGLLLPLVDGGIGGDRPVSVLAPPNVPAGALRPLVVLLHPFAFSAATEDEFLGLSPRVLASGAFFAAPSGFRNSQQKPYWNATDACCDLEDSGVDDAGYVRSVIRTIVTSYPIDARRVWVFGHSNGAFLAHRIACDEASLVTGILAMGGATFQDPARCKPDVPLHVLTIHGTNDVTIPYAGGETKKADGSTVPYPGEVVTTSRWAGLNGCKQPWIEEPEKRSYLRVSTEPDTTVFRFEGCPTAGAVEHWRIDGGPHAPVLADTFWEDAFRFMAAHPRP